MNLSALWGRRGDVPSRLLDSLAFLDREPIAAFRAQETDHLTARQLNDFREDAFIFRKRELGLLPEEKAHDEHVDRAALVLALEGSQEYEQQFVSGGPVDPETGKPHSVYSSEYRAWETAQDRTVLTIEQAKAIEQIAYGVRTHPEVRKLLVDGVAQGVVRCDYVDVPCQGRPDWLSRTQGLVGLVVCDSLSWLEPTMRIRGVVHRLAFEHGLIEQVTEVDVPVHVIAIEKRPPYRCGVWMISDPLVRKARQENEAAIGQLTSCRESDCWPTGYEQMRVLSPNRF
jgi:hypothetical protein